VCSLEVPDIENAVSSRYSDDDVVVWLLNTEDEPEVVRDFTADAGLTVPSLLGAEDLYERYKREGHAGGEDPWAPYPLQVVVDGEGTIRYVAQQYDATRVTDLIDRLLAESR
jgi:peroxiredoxin